ncbi:hypothetical protein NQZ68_023224 [Dissostichus eleginoides]|nr:hypothetical protein NQZ68_023224 [Dissostichus eleginoides]
MNSSKSVNSTAIRAEIKRHESLQSAINRLSKQFERVENPQQRSGLKVFLHSIQVSVSHSGKLTLISFSFHSGDKNPPPVVRPFIYYLSASGHEATNGNIPQQPSPWQQDETCCAAYFLIKVSVSSTGAWICECRVHWG